MITEPFRHLLARILVGILTVFLFIFLSRDFLIKKKIANTLAKPEEAEKLAERVSEELAKREQRLYFKQKGGPEADAFIDSEIAQSVKVPNPDKPRLVSNHERQELEFKQEHEFYRWLASLGGRILVDKTRARVILTGLESLANERAESDLSILPPSLSGKGKFFFLA